MRFPFSPFFFFFWFTVFFGFIVVGTVEIDRYQLFTNIDDFYTKSFIISFCQSKSTNIKKATEKKQSIQFISYFIFPNDCSVPFPSEPWTLFQWTPIIKCLRFVSSCKSQTLHFSLGVQFIFSACTSKIFLHIQTQSLDTSNQWKEKLYYGKSFSFCLLLSPSPFCKYRKKPIFFPLSKR